MSLAQFDEIDERQAQAIDLLVDGKSYADVARAVGVDDSTLRRWRRQPNFMAAMGQSMLTNGLANQSERIRIATTALNSMIDPTTGVVATDADPLDWLKYISSEVGQANAKVSDLTQKLKTFEVLRYLLLQETCDDCRRKVAARLVDLAKETRDTPELSE